MNAQVVTPPAAPKHSPGPWRAIRALKPCGIERSFDYGIAAEGTDNLLAEAFEVVGYAADGVSYQRVSAEANAQLIAASPDMAEALLGLDLACSNDALNPCWDNRPTDVAGKHWGIGKACPQCTARAALAKAGL